MILINSWGNSNPFVFFLVHHLKISSESFSVVFIVALAVVFDFGFLWSGLFFSAILLLDCDSCLSFENV